MITKRGVVNEEIPFEFVSWCQAISNEDMKFTWNNIICSYDPKNNDSDKAVVDWTLLCYYSNIK